MFCGWGNQPLLCSLHSSGWCRWPSDGYCGGDYLVSEPRHRAGNGCCGCKPEVCPDRHKHPINKPERGGGSPLSPRKGLAPKVLFPTFRWYNIENWVRVARLKLAWPYDQGGGSAPCLPIAPHPHGTLEARGIEPLTDRFTRPRSHQAAPIGKSGVPIGPQSQMVRRFLFSEVYSCELCSKKG